MKINLSRRGCLQALAAGVLSARTSAEDESAFAAGPAPGAEPFFQTRGVVLVVEDLRTLDWPVRAQKAGLTTLATHIFPSEIARFVKTERGRWFLEECRQRGLQVEHELHAMSDLLPRSLFDKNPAMFPMNDKGERVRDYNLCLHSKNALEIVCENAVKYTRVLRSTTGRYFYWPDDGRPMCRCPRCKDLSDSDQALMLENRMLQALRSVDPRATLAHIAYATTLPPPRKIKPAAGIFLEFAPISRVYDRPFRQRDARLGNYPTHGELLDLLDANLQVLGRQGAQALEYWLDLSRFSGWQRKNVKKLPWNEAVFLDDLRTYAARGIRHITTFGAWLDGNYVHKFGEPPLKEYGAGLLQRR
jgi:hypothetical protein